MVNVAVEPTPNPGTLKFIPGCPVMDKGSANFASPDDADTSPLAARLFRIQGVAGVFLGADFITVAKRAAAKWDDIEAPVAAEIAAHFEAGAPVIESGFANDALEPAGEESETVRQIRELLETRIRPSVTADGGDIVFRGFDDGVVYLSLQGACIGCPSSSATLKMGVENLLKFYVPEVDRVEQAA